MAKKKAGPGMKQCPKCENYMGVRTQVCECGHKFTKSRKGASHTESLPVSTDGIATVLAAQRLIRDCGGTARAVGLLKTVGKSGR
jgi:hypothetical protein